MSRSSAAYDLRPIVLFEPRPERPNAVPKQTTDDGRPRGFRALGLVLLLLAIFNVALFEPEFLPGQAFTLSFLLTIPGALLLAAAPDLPHSGWQRLAAAVGGSVLILMLVALGLSWVGPSLGITRPFTRPNIALTVDAVSLLLALAAVRHGDPMDRLLGEARSSARGMLIIAGFALFPLAAFAGAQLLNNGLGGTVALVAVAAAGGLVIGLVPAGDRLPDWAMAAGLWCAALAMLWGFSLRGIGVFGFDIQQELQSFAVTMRAGGWHIPANGDAYRSMLSISALPALLSTVTGVSGEGLYKIVYPMIFALVPGALFELCRRWLPRRAAAVAAAYFVVLPQFGGQMIALARQEVAMLFVVLMVALAFDDGLRVEVRRGAVMLAGAGVAMSHYTTAYLMSALLAGTWIVYFVVRMSTSRRHRLPRPRAAFSLGVVVAVVGATLMWNVVITRASTNASSFAEAVSSRGIDLLPQSTDGSLISRWLKGNAPETISAPEFYRRSDIVLRRTSPWINHYPPEVAAASPPQQREYPEVGGNPTLAAGAALASTVFGQLFLLMTVGGLFMLLFRRRGGAAQGIDLELAVMGVGMLGFVALMRVSGVAALAFNPERAQLISLTVLGVAFGAGAAWLLRRRPKLTLAGLCLGLGALYVQGSGLAVEAGGGNPNVNLHNAGTSYERFTVSAEERSAGQWLVDSIPEHPLIFADRFGRLRLLGTSPAFDRKVVDSLTPLTLDTGAWVFARDTNLREGRAEGSIGNDFSVYEFPKEFLDANKNVVYTTENTRIWR